MDVLLFDELLIGFDVVVVVGICLVLCSVVVRSGCVVVLMIYDLLDVFMLVDWVLVFEFGMIVEIGLVVDVFIVFCSCFGVCIVGVNLVNGIIGLDGLLCI